MDEFLDEVKDYLHITWDGDDNNINLFLNNGRAMLQGLTGAKLDFNNNMEAKALLFDYCRYAYNKALEYYEVNFQAQLLRLNLKEAVKIAESD